MTTSNGAEIPPGFPIAAVDRSLASIPGLQSLGKDGPTNSGEVGPSTNDWHQSAPVLQSTTQLRGRRANMAVANASNITSMRRQTSVGRSISGGITGGFESNSIRQTVAQEIQAMERHKPVGRKASLDPVTPAPSSPRRRGTRRSNSTGPVVSPLRRRGQAEIDADANLHHVPDGDHVVTTKEPKKSWWNLSPLNRRSRSADSVSPRTKKPSLRGSGKYPSGQKLNIPEIELASNLNKVNDKKSSINPFPGDGTKKSIASVPALASKDSTSSREKMRGKKKGTPLKSKSSKKKTKDGPVGEEQDKPKSKENFNCSMASLDPDLLMQSPTPLETVAFVAEIFEEDRESTAESPKSTESDASVSPCSSFSPRTPGVLKRRAGQSPSAADHDDRRVSWVELPLHNPNQLLLKTAEENGTNETCVTQEFDQLSSHTNNNDEAPLKSSSENEGTETAERRERPNPSLESAFRRNSPRGQSHAHDERTVGTNVTSKSGTTNTSESTVKTTNRNPALKRRLTMNDPPNESCSEMEHDRERTSHEIQEPDTQEQGSFGSMESRSSRSSRSSRRSKESSSHDDSPHTKLPASQKNRNRRDSEGTGPKGRKSSTKSGSGARGKVNFIPKGKCNDSQTNVDPAEENVTASIEDGAEPGALKRISSIASDSSSLNSRRKKSYLPQRGSKVEKNESKGLKSSVNSSLDMFLQTAAMKKPNVSRTSGSRSVQSALEPGAGERARRAREEKRKNAASSLTPSRRSSSIHFSPSHAKDAGRSGVGKQRMPVHDSGDNDDMSVTSAPMLHALSTPVRFPPKEDQHRAVVDLKQTHFSSKLSKLHVAF